MSTQLRNYRIGVLSCNNFFPYEEQTLLIAWKAGKKIKGETSAATVKHNNADIKSSFQFQAKLKPARKGGLDRFPLHLSVLCVSGKKTKEIGACEVNLSDFITPKAAPYGAKVRIEWSVKLGKEFDALLAKNAACILIHIDPSLVQDDSKETESKKTITPPTSARGNKPLVPRLPSVRGETSSNPFAPTSAPPPSASPLQSPSNSEDRQKSVEESSEEPESAPSAASSSSNPFASLSRKVGSGDEPSSQSPRVQRPASDIQDDAGAMLTSKPTFVKNHSSPSGSMTAAPAESDKDVRKIMAENRKLREQLEKAEERRTESNKKTQALQSKLKQLEKSVPKASMKELRKDGYVREGALPDAAAAVGDSQIGDNVMMSVRAMLEDSENLSFSNVIYWLSWAANLHMSFSAQRGRKSSFVEHGVEVRKRSASAAPDRGTMRRFIWDLEQLIEDAYRLSIRVVTREIKNLVDRKVRSFWDVEVESSVVGQDMVDNFERWFTAMLGCNIPTQVLNQWIFQTLYILNAAIFNSFLQNPRMLEPTIALQLKFYTSELENWGSEHANVLYHWRSFRGQLQPLVDLSNLLLLDKANIDVEMLRDGAPSLSLLQVKFLLEIYSDVAPEHDRVPRNVLKEVSDAAQLDIDQRVPMERAAFSDQWFALEDLVRPSK